MRTITLAMAILFSFTAFAREAKLSGNQPKPLSFIENKGQVTDQYGKQRKDIDVKLEIPGMSVFIGDGAIHYQWYKQNNASVTSPSAPGVIRSAHEIADAKLKGGTSADNRKHEALTVETYRMDVELVGANKNAEVVYEEMQDYYENYYLTQFPGGAVANTYNRITYRNVYPGIDWVLYSKDNQLKYDFVVLAGADPSLIKLRYQGATKLKLLNGELIATSPFGTITEGAPFSYDAIAKQPLRSAYKLDDNILSFDLQDSHDEGIIIDPYLGWATYYGGSASDLFEGVCTDKVGAVYATGSTGSPTNIATTGAFQTSLPTPPCGMIVKFDSSGVRQWGTYYGNSGVSSGVGFRSICSDENNNVYVTGHCSGFGLASAGAHQTAPVAPSYDEALLAKFGSNGQRLWATYYGGQNWDDAFTVFADTTGVYIGGTTNSTTGIATPGAFQSTLGSSTGDAFVAKFNSVGLRLWGTYYTSVGINTITGHGDSLI